MASYASNPTQYQPPLPTFSFELIGKALQYKQQTADISTARVQAEIDSYAKIDLARNVDRAYLANNLQNLISSVNATPGADWSSQNTTSLIQNHVKQAIDKNVITAAASTQKLRKLQSEIDHFKTKETDKYNPINESFALRGAEAWLSNPNVGAAYQGGTYNPYEDVNKTMLDVVKDLKDTKGDQVVEIPITDANGNRRIQRKTIKGLTSQEIQAYLPNLLPPTTKQQLQINGWSQFAGNGGLQAAQTIFNDYTQQRTAELNKTIETNRLGENTTGISKTQRQQYSANKQAAIREKENFAAKMSSINTNDTASLGGFIEENRWLNNFSQIAGARISTEYETDTAFYAQKRLELDYVKENRQQQEFELNRLKTGLEIQKLQGELNPQPVVTLSPDVRPTEENLNPYEDAKKEYQNYANQTYSTINSTYANAPEDKKALFDEERSKLQKEGLSYIDASAAAFKNTFAKTNPAQMGEIVRLQTLRDTQARVIFKAQDEGLVRELEENADNYYGQLTTLAQSIPEVRKFIADNRVTAQNIANRNDIQVTRQAADLLEKYATDLTLDTSTGNVNSQSIPGISLTALVFGNRGIQNPKQAAKVRAGEIIVEQGYSGFNRGVAATIGDKKTRELISNSIPQTSANGAFEADKPMTVNMNSDGSLTITQNAELRKDGEIITVPRTAVVPANSDLYDGITSIIKPSSERVVRLSGTSSTPTTTVSYIQDNDKVSQRKNADYLIQKTGGQLTPSRVNPVNYLTPSNTRQTYKTALRGRVSEQKIDQLVDAMDDNQHKLQVKTFVDNGEYVVKTTVNSAIPYTIGEDNGGGESNTDNINLYVQQFPQVSIGEAILQRLNENPKEIDNIINSLQE